jgi:hypothetical protein
MLDATSSLRELVLGAGIQFSENICMDILIEGSLEDTSGLKLLALRRLEVVNDLSWQTEQWCKLLRSLSGPPNLQCLEMALPYNTESITTTLAENVVLHPQCCCIERLKINWILGNDGEQTDEDQDWDEMGAISFAAFFSSIQKNVSISCLDFDLYHYTGMEFFPDSVMAHLFNIALSPVWSLESDRPDLYLVRELSNYVSPYETFDASKAHEKNIKEFKFCWNPKLLFDNKFQPEQTSDACSIF